MAGGHGANVTGSGRCDTPHGVAERGGAIGRARGEPLSDVSARTHEPSPLHPSTARLLLARVIASSATALAFLRSGSSDRWWRASGVIQITRGARVAFAQRSGSGDGAGCGGEGGGGGREMCEDGMMDQFGIQEVYAMHNWPHFASGANTAPLKMAYGRAETQNIR